jgi:hypothetical protein
MKLEPHRVGRKRPTRQPRPFDHALTLFDPLLARPAFVVEGDDPLGGTDPSRAGSRPTSSSDNVLAYNGMNCTVKDLADWANEMA